MCRDTSVPLLAMSFHLLSPGGTAGGWKKWAHMVPTAKSHQAAHIRSTIHGQPREQKKFSETVPMSLLEQWKPETAMEAPPQLKPCCTGPFTASISAGPDIFK